VTARLSEAQRAALVRLAALRGPVRTGRSIQTATARALAREGLAEVTVERRYPSVYGRPVDVTRVRITEAGKAALAL
jgi:hypothetical protein